MTLLLFQTYAIAAAAVYKDTPLAIMQASSPAQGLTDLLNTSYMCPLPGCRASHTASQAAAVLQAAPAPAYGRSILLPKMRKGTPARPSSLSSPMSSRWLSGKRSRSAASTRYTMASTCVVICTKVAQISARHMRACDVQTASAAQQVNSPARATVPELVLCSKEQQAQPDSCTSCC